MYRCWSRRSPPWAGVSNHLNADVDPQPMGNENFSAAPSGTFETGDGPLNIAANEQKQYEALCDVVERPARKDNRIMLKTELDAALKARSAIEWERALNAIGIPAGRVLTVPEILN